MQIFKKNSPFRLLPATSRVLPLIVAAFIVAGLRHKRMHAVAGVLCISLVACATPDVDRSVVGFDDIKFELKSAACHVYPLVVPIASGVGGVALCLIHFPPIDPVELTIEAAVCGTTGFGLGAYTVIDDYDGMVEKCLREEGYSILENGTSSRRYL
jgi:hypothetical protein